MTHRVADDTPATGDLTGTFLIDGQYIRARTRVPLESGIDNVLDAVRAGYAVRIEALPGMNTRAVCDELYEKIVARDPESPERIRGADTRRAIYRLLHMQVA